MARTIIEELIVKYGGDASGIQLASARANNSMDGFKRNTENVASAVTKSFLRMASAYLSFHGVIKTARIADEFTLLESRIENATRGAAEFAQAMEGLKDIARTTGADLGATVDVFQRISFVRDEIKATTDDMLQFTETVSQLGVISGASTSALKAGLTQLGQSLSSEIVRAEEFNSIMENIPAVGQAIAESLGVTTGELRQLVIEGEVLSKDVFAAILHQSKEVNKQFAEMPETIDRAFARLRVNFGDAVSLINKSTGATQGFVEAINKMNEALERFTERSRKHDEIRAAILDSRNDPYVSPEDRVTGQSQRAIRNGTQTLDDMLIFGEPGSSKNPMADKAEEYRKKLEGLGDEKEKTAKKSRRLRIDLNEATAAMQAQDSAIDMLVDGLARGGNAFDNFRDTALRAISDVAKNMLKLSLGGKADSGLGGMLASGIMSAGFVSSTGTAGFSSRSFGQLALASGAGAYGPGFATGGEFTVGGAGGRDANMVSMKVSRGEKVKITTPQQSGGDGGLTVQQNFNISLGVAQTVRAELARYMPIIKGQTVDGVQEAQRRGKT